MRRRPIVQLEPEDEFRRSPIVENQVISPVKVLLL